MIDDFAKACLQNDLREIRQVMLDKLDGLGEYAVRRPLTATGTNLLGLIKHLSLWESWYLGEVFGRPFPEPLPGWDDAAARGVDMWVTEYETRDEIVDRYHRVWEHSDATITALAIDARGYVPWWPSPNVTLFNVLVHMLTETRRTRRHSARTTRRIDRDGGRTCEPAARRGLLGSQVRRDRTGRHSSRSSRCPPGSQEFLDLYFAHGVLLRHDPRGWVGSTLSRARSLVCRYPGWGILGGLPLWAGISRSSPRAWRMRRPVGGTALPSV